MPSSKYGKHIFENLSHTKSISKNTHLILIVLLSQVVYDLN